MSQDPNRPEDTQPQWEPAQPGAPDVGAGPPSGQRKKRNRTVAGIILGVLAMAGVAFAALTLFNVFAGTHDVLAEKVPARSLLYVTAYLDPGAGQKVNLKDLAGKFPALQGRDLGQSLSQGLDLLAAQSGLSFSGDIEPWLGSQMALAFEAPSGPEPGFALLVDSKDDGRATAAMSKVEGTEQLGGGMDWKSEPYRGVDVRVGQAAPGVTDRAYAVVDNTVVVSTDPDVVHEVIDTIQGRSANLADDTTYQDTIEGLPKSVLGLAYVDMRSAVDLLGGGFFSDSGASGGLVTPPSPTFAASASNQVTNPLTQLQAFKGLGFSLSAQKAGFELDFALDVDRSKLPPEQQAAFAEASNPGDALQSVPSRAYGVLAFGGVRQLVQSFVTQAQQNPEFGTIVNRLGLQDVVDHLTGQAALEVGPGPTRLPGGAVLIGTNDATGMQRFLDRAATQLPTSSGPGGRSPLQTQEYKGVTIHFAAGALPDESGVRPAYAVANGFGILATSPDEVKAVIDAHAGSSITAAPTFKDAQAQVPQGNSVLYLDVQAILQALGPQLSDIFGTQFSLVEPNLRPVKALIVTGETTGDVVKSHLFLLIR
jgi:uncharacterized protein DUF3352